MARVELNCVPFRTGKLHYSASSHCVLAAHAGIIMRIESTQPLEDLSSRFIKRMESGLETRYS